MQRNHPPKSGAIHWARMLQQRLKNLIISFQNVPELIYHNIKKKAYDFYVSISLNLSDYEQQIYIQWLDDNLPVVSEIFGDHILKKLYNSSLGKYIDNNNIYYV